MEYRKLVSIEVRGDHIYSDKVSIGAVGTQNVTALDIFFDDQWEGLNPMVFWFNAMDHETQVAETILTSADKIEDLHYRVTIPHEVFEYKGNAAFVVEGTTVIDEAVVSLPTEYGYLIVRGSSNEVMDIPSEDDPMSILQQVQNLENLASGHAQSAAESAEESTQAAASAAESVVQIYAEVDAAEAFAASARTSAGQAAGYTNTAQSYVIDAQGFADNARSSATSAGQSAAQSEASAEAAETQAMAASSSASTAGTYATEAQAQSVAAENAAVSAALSQAAAQSFAAQAQASAEAAEQEFTTLEADLEEHVSDTDIHITAEERARWNAGGGGGGGTNDYNALSNKPSIGGVTLSGNKTLADLGFSTADCEKLSNKVTAIDGATATDTNYPSEKAVSEALIALSASLSSSFGSQISGLSQAVFQSLGYKESSSNKSTSISGSGSATNYPTTKAVVDYVALMGFESASNKSTTLDSSTTKFPTNSAVKSYVDTVIGDIETALDGIIRG